MILIGGKEPVRITVGDKEVKAVMLGGNKIWPAMGRLKLYSNSDKKIHITLYLNDSKNPEFIDIPNIGTPYIKQCDRKVTYLKLQNEGDNLLKRFEFENIDEFTPTSLASIFYYLKIDEIELKNIKAPNVTSMNRMLMNSTVSKMIFDVEAENVSDFTYAFSGLQNLEEIDLSKIKSVVGSIFLNMFQNCKNLKKCIIPKIGEDVEPYSNTYDSMFKGCVSLEEVDISSLNLDSVVAYFKKYPSYGTLFKDSPNIKKVWVTYDKAIQIINYAEYNKALGLPQTFLENIMSDNREYVLMIDGVDVRDT